MKKRLLMLLDFGLSLASNIHAEDLYLVGDGTIIGWTQQDELKRQPTKMMETSSGVYEWTGLLKHASEGFSIRKNLNWEGYFPTTSNYAISDVGGTSDYNTSSDYKWNPTNTDWGWYTITLDTNQGKFSWVSASPTLLEPVDGVYYISTAEQLNTLAFMLRNNVNKESYNVKLTADIDYTAYTHSSFAALGVNEDFPFKGDFDGQNHTITIDLTTYCKCFGLFGTVEGTIHNLKVAGKITATTRNQIGGICGLLKGSITSNAEGGAISGYSGGDGSHVFNCYNSGIVKNGGEVSKAFCRSTGAHFEDCYYTEGSGTDNSTENKTYGQPSMVTDDALASGELCYKLNNGLSTIAWYQKLGEGGDAYPDLFGTDRVYLTGHKHCDGTLYEDETGYSNTETVIEIDSHTYVDGICSYCGELDESYVTLTDGYYQISTEKQLVWFAKKVQKGINIVGGKKILK